MKKRILGMMLFAGALAFAQTTFKIQADRETCLYACGERATFTVTAVDSNGVPVKAGTVTASLDNFGPKKFEKRSVDLARENPFTVVGTLAEPGFLRLCLAGKDCRNQVFGVGYEPEKLEKGSPSPDDFDAFWADARAKLARDVPLDAQVVRMPERCTKDFDFFRISFATFGRRVYGYMSVPTDRARAPYPVDFQVAAAGFGGWTNNMQGQKDAISVFFSVYPFEPHWDWEKIGLKAKYDALNDACQAKYGTGYATSGIAESREAYFFYPVLLGIDRAVDWVVARPDVDRTRVRYQGTSQGGGFGFYLTGLNHAFTRAAFYVPAITDTMGYLKGRQSGWPQIVEHNSTTPAKRAAAEKYAPYFDGANFAARIRCPVRVAVGFADTTCAPGAVYAAYNAIPVKDKGIVHGIGMGHGCFWKFYQELGAWVRDDGKARAATVTLDLPKDGAMPVTAALQKAIDDLSSAGGGKLVLPAGTYLTGGIFLKDRVTLHLAKGATLLGSTNHLDYAGHKAVIGAVQAQQVALEGEGTVDGRGWAVPVRDGAPNRWKCCFFFRCADVRVEGVKLTNPASWTCHFKECDGVLARKVTIFSHANYNNDGFDIDSKNVLIEDCTVDSDDDAICPKSDNPNFVPENIEVRNCRLASNCNFIKFGTSSRGGFRNCRIHHCTLVPASQSNLRKWQHRLPGVTDPISGLAGIALEMVDGGAMENIRVHDIVMEGGMQTPVFVRLGRRNVHPSGARAELKNCVIENVTCRSTASFIASSITGVPGLRVQDLTLRNLDFTVKGGCTAAEAKKRVPEAEKAYPENRMFAKLPLPAYGFYLRHADGIRFENVKLRFAGLREEREPVVQDDCTGVEFVNCDFRRADRPLPAGSVVCAGDYDGHLQGVATDGAALYWSFTKTIVKTDLKGCVLASTRQPSHQGDCCVKDGLLYVAVNLGRFNTETGGVSGVWAYDTRDLALKRKWDVPQLVHGAGGITWHDGLFYVVGGLPPTHTRNYVYAYTPDFQFLRRHDLATGYTVLGIQTATFLRDRFVFGCYSSKQFPIRTLVCPPDLASFTTAPESTDVGVVELDGRILCARTRKTGAQTWGGFLVPSKTLFVNQRSN